MNNDTNDVMTPTQALAASEPSIGHAIHGINAGLAAGERRFTVTPGLAMRIAARMRAKGWTITVIPSDHRNATYIAAAGPGEQEP